jgi:hypothetical protein
MYQDSTFPYFVFIQTVSIPFTFGGWPDVAPINPLGNSMARCITNMRIQ